MNILALDLGTHTGWALSEGGRVESGVQTFDVKRGESPGMRYVRFNRWLEDALGLFRDGQDRPCDLIAYELPHLRGGAAATLLAGMQTRIEEFCARRGIEHVGVHSATLKKATTGSGRGDKTAMFHAAFVRGWISGQPSDDEVDAVCLLHYALAELVPSREAEPSAPPGGRT